jgi:hypothetical protein
MKKYQFVISLLALLVLFLWFIYTNECSRLSERALILMKSESDRWKEMRNRDTARSKPIFSIGLRGLESQVSASPGGIRTSKSLRLIRVTVSSFGRETIFTDSGIPF